MTSREAFEKIVEVCEFYHKEYTNVKPTHIYEYPIDKIRKDLEVLEILKKYVSIAMFDAMDDIEKEKVWEWLENE